MSAKWETVTVHWFSTVIFTMALAYILHYLLWLSTSQESHVNQINKISECTSSIRGNSCPTACVFACLSVPVSLFLITKPQRYVSPWVYLTSCRIHPLMLWLANCKDINKYTLNLLVIFITPPGWLGSDERWINLSNHPYSVFRK